MAHLHFFTSIKAAGITSSCPQPVLTLSLPGSLQAHSAADVTEPCTSLHIPVWKELISNSISYVNGDKPMVFHGWESAAISLTSLTPPPGPPVCVQAIPRPPITSPHRHQESSQPDSNMVGEVGPAPRQRSSNYHYCVCIITVCVLGVT